MAHMNITRRQLGGAALALAALGLPRGARAQGAPLKIGTVLSVTGPAAFLGEDMKRGMEIAVGEINGAGGINGRKIEWIFYDAESQAAKGVNATKRLIEQDKVEMIVGGGNMSGIALGMAPLIEKAAVPFISTEGALAIVAPVAEREYAFKTTLDDSQVIERAIDFWHKKGIKKVALVADNSGFGQGAKAQMELIAPKAGIEVVYESFTPSDTTMMPQLTSVKQANVPGDPVLDRRAVGRRVPEGGQAARPRRQDDHARLRLRVAAIYDARRRRRERAAADRPEIPDRRRSARQRSGQARQRGARCQIQQGLRQGPEPVRRADLRCDLHGQVRAREGWRRPPEDPRRARRPARLQGGWAAISRSRRSAIPA